MTADITLDLMRAIDALAWKPELEPTAGAS